MDSAVDVEKDKESDINTLSYEAASEKLEGILAALESGELSLEESLALYEKGAALANHCEATLDNAELRVRQWQPTGEVENFGGWQDDQSGQGEQA